MMGNKKKILTFAMIILSMSVNAIAAEAEAPKDKPTELKESFKVEEAVPPSSERVIASEPEAVKPEAERPEGQELKPWIYKNKLGTDH